MQRETLSHEGVLASGHDSQQERPLEGRKQGDRPLSITPGMHASRWRRRHVLPRFPLAMLATALALTCIRVQGRPAATRQTRGSQEALARQQLADTAIFAPFAGAVQERRASIGEYLGAGAPVAAIVRMNPSRLRVEVPEREAPTVRIGQSVRSRPKATRTSIWGASRGSARSIRHRCVCSR
jgi:multidrug efflux pump subunit AcrA (membrane-fusion protein)